MVESIYFLKPAWCGDHPAGLWPELGLTVRYGSHSLQAVLVHYRAVKEEHIQRNTTETAGTLLPERDGTAGKPGHIIGSASRRGQRCCTCRRRKRSPFGSRQRRRSTKICPPS